MSPLILTLDATPGDAAARVAAHIAAPGVDPAAIRVVDLAMGHGARLLAVARVLADALIAAGRAPGAARRHVAARCLYGIDPLRPAVTAARDAVETWAAGDGPRPCVDHALRRGDHTRGFGPAQLAAFHPAPESAAPHPALAARLRALHAAHRPLRRAVLALAPTDAEAARAALAVADAHNDLVRVVGDVLAGAADDPPERARLLDLIERWITDAADAADAEADLRRAQAAVRARWATFHRVAEFSELYPLEAA